MTTDQFFKKYPGAQDVLKVGEKLFFANYTASANKAALRAGLPLERINRPVPVAKSAKQEAKPEVPTSQSAE